MTDLVPFDRVGRKTSRGNVLPLSCQKLLFEAEDSFTRQTFTRLKYFVDWQSLIRRMDEHSASNFKKTIGRALFDAFLDQNPVEGFKSLGFLVFIGPTH